MAAQRGSTKMMKALGLHHVPIHITGCCSAPRKANAEGSTGVSEMLLTMGNTSAMRVLLAFLLLPTCALGANSVVNM